MRLFRKEENYTLIINDEIDAIFIMPMERLIRHDLDCERVYTSLVKKNGVTKGYTKIEFDTKHKQKKVINSLRKRVPKCYDLYVKDNEIVAY